MSTATTAPPQYRLGFVITQLARGRLYRYVLTGKRPYTNRHGRETLLLMWTGEYTSCGSPFTVTSGRKPSYYLNRHCPAHVQRCGGGAK
jgi:hypothetical protein